MRGKKIKEILKKMTSTNWLPYYVLYMQQQQRAKKAEEEKKKAEEEARKVQEEAQRQTEQQQAEATEQKVEESSTKEQSNEEQKTEELKVETTTETETKKEETPTVLEKVENKSQTTVASTYKPKPTDCELLYEIGSSDYATCDYARAQNAQANSNIAMMLMFCLAAGVGIAALIVHCVDRKVDEGYRSGGGYFLG